MQVRHHLRNFSKDNKRALKYAVNVPNVRFDSYRKNLR